MAYMQINNKPCLRVTQRNVLESKTFNEHVSSYPQPPSIDLVLANEFLILSASYSLQQNVMLDLSKRSRSGKFRLVTKFKKEKNNKNKEVHSSLGAPGTCLSPSCLSLAVNASCPGSVLLVSAFLLSLEILPFGPFAMIPSHVGCTSLSCSYKTKPCLLPFSVWILTDMPCSSAPSMETVG